MDSVKTATEGIVRLHDKARALGWSEAAIAGCDMAISRVLQQNEDSAITLLKYGDSFESIVAPLWNEAFDKHDQSLIDAFEALGKDHVKAFHEIYDKL